MITTQLMMSGSPKVGQKSYQELAPGVAMDRVEIMVFDEKIATSVSVRETSSLKKVYGTK